VPSKTKGGNRPAVRPRLRSQRFAPNRITATLRFAMLVFRVSDRSAAPRAPVSAGRRLCTGLLRPPRPRPL